MMRNDIKIYGAKELEPIVVAISTTYKLSFREKNNI